MIYLDAVILISFRIINGDRSRSAIFHLLTGKKSSQTIQDAHLYGVSNLFQTMPKLARSYFDERCEILLKEKLIKEIKEQRYVVTKKGENFLEDYFHKHPFPTHLNGWLYHDRAGVFWGRLNLLVQSASNLLKTKKNYYPVQRETEIQQWVRETFNKWGKLRKEKIEEFKQELIVLCQSIDFPDIPELIIFRLSGAQSIGLTIDQMAHRFKVDQTEIHFRFLHSLHYCMEKIQNQPDAFPLLFGVMQNIMSPPVILTSSTEKTYVYLEKDFPLRDIAKIRNLKESTIEDHIIELALMIPSFDITMFLPNELQNQIWITAKRLNHRRLREIKEEIPEASYFQIRLVLVKRGRESVKWKDYSLKSSATGLLEKDKKK